jgi:nicotinate-nucleotide--dimethylbenzimidazole phosphoribosyltransferase
MTDAECEQAIEIGREQVRLAVEAGIDVLGIGEMGIGNTTAASALVVALLGFDAEKAVGRGTGISNAVLNRKVEVVASCESTRASHRAARAILAANHRRIRIAAMTGTILEAARVRMPFVVDGFIGDRCGGWLTSTRHAARPVFSAIARTSKRTAIRWKALRVEPIST